MRPPNFSEHGHGKGSTGKRVIIRLHIVGFCTRLQHALLLQARQVILDAVKASSNAACPAHSASTGKRALQGEIPQAIHSRHGAASWQADY